MNIQHVFFWKKSRPDHKDNQQDADASGNQPASLHERIIDVLKNIYDPELPVNIYDLGLIYDIKINQHQDVKISMTLTAPACPVAGSLPGQVEAAVKKLSDINTVEVELVWEPPWSQAAMSEEARYILGMF